MRLLRLSANDTRFKVVNFQPGLNIVVAERKEESSQGESRNGTGKTSLVLLVRYLLGGSLPARLKRPEFERWRFTLEVLLPGAGGQEETVRVTRGVSDAQTRISVVGWSYIENRSDLRVAEWRAAQAAVLFSLREDAPPELTPGALWAYFLRSQFGTPVRVQPTDSEWLVGLKLGYLLGLAPNVAAAPGEVATLERQRKALNQAISEGALQHLRLDEAQLRSELAGVLGERSRLAGQLENFQVNSEYESNQQRANELSQSIRRINEELLALANRASELDRVINEETARADATEDSRIGRMYRELGLVLPDQVSRRFDEVSSFHQSVARNRAQFLIAERDDVADRMTRLSESRRQQDADRAGVMVILRSSVAFDTFLTAQSRLAQLETQALDIERRLDTAASVGEIATVIRGKRAESERVVRQELQDRQDFLVAGPLALFKELGQEIYSDRVSDLLVSSGKDGAVRVAPQVSGDASDGIRGVETFLLDVTLVVTSLSLGRSPGLLIHDSHLFDAVDHRQVASCLNIGARLAEQFEFQYVVTMNSDFLRSVVSEGSFDPSPYLLDVGLSDSEGGGLFGFAFD